MTVKDLRSELEEKYPDDVEVYIEYDGIARCSSDISYCWMKTSFNKDERPSAYLVIS